MVAFTQELAKVERQNMEYKIAEAIVADYLAGMTDNTFKQVAIEYGGASRQNIENSQRNVGKSSSVQEALKHLEGPKTR